MFEATSVFEEMNFKTEEMTSSLMAVVKISTTNLNVNYFLMASPSPLNDTAIKKRTFFAASFIVTLALYKNVLCISYGQKNPDVYQVHLPYLVLMF